MSKNSLPPPTPSISSLITLGTYLEPGLKTKTKIMVNNLYHTVKNIRKQAIDFFMSIFF